MNKAQLVEAIADKVGGRQQAAEAVDAVLDAIVRAVVGGDRVSVTGFGSFEKVDRPARYARNPQTGERVRVKKTSVPRFRAGQGFKDLVSGSKKLPRGGEVAVKKAPKGSLTGGVAARATVKKAAAKKATTAKKATAKKTVAKTAAAKKTTAKKTVAKKAVAKKTTAKKATTAKKTTAKKATAKKTAPAKKATAKKAPAKKATSRKTTAKKTTARKK
ncbi:HU family DNA-binding protein [Streptomyces lunaelactis]|uniref:HU family DNA-binding protein n=1 Tax=Streptomyces lunaelactis TaxID=1535768 RepID=UPI001584A2AC|nr:HU family DNA-binding protein [Streptomyces lunaelactis]NUJ99740.1 HU family DNA-binding protein [Streptomyces lunaelactis]NUK14584.1 HU family DNA-binding protein [Streptomyces lunaelactis]NUK34389.1 HU family DNA-binding protein [Streptomyces lunaelactis]NUK72388.1 HU family DNA-binding protein [Streptomyces lunaelactis]NUK75951.1 HU family DNA-binding protein [Streptomyces lunaelactis]